MMSLKELEDAPIKHLFCHMLSTSDRVAWHGNARDQARARALAQDPPAQDPARAIPSTHHSQEPTSHPAPQPHPTTLTYPSARPSPRQSPPHAPPRHEVVATVAEIGSNTAAEREHFAAIPLMMGVTTFLPNQADEHGNKTPGWLTSAPEPVVDYLVWHATTLAEPLEIAHDTITYSIKFVPFDNDAGPASSVKDTNSQIFKAYLKRNARQIEKATATETRRTQPPPSQATRFREPSPTSPSTP